MSKKFKTRLPFRDFCDNAETSERENVFPKDSSLIYIWSLKILKGEGNENSSKKSDVIGFYKEPIPRIVMVRSIENQEVVGHRGWGGAINNDDKVIAKFVKNEEAFQSFLLTISEMVGFKYKLKKTKNGVVGIILNDVYCE